MIGGGFSEAKDGKFSFNSKCPFCGDQNPPIVATQEDWDMYLAGSISALELTQDKDVAEYLISGCCIPCWDRMFTEEDEDDQEPEHIEDPMDAMYGGNIDGGWKNNPRNPRFLPDYEGPED